MSTVGNYTPDQLKREELRRARMLLYRHEPLLWLTERFGEDPLDYKWSEFGEGYKGHIWDGDVDPLYNAWLDLANRQNVSIQAATGTSKTYFLARVVFWFLDVYKDSLVITVAPKQEQLRKNLWRELSRSMYKFNRLHPDAEILTDTLKVLGKRPDSDLQNDFTKYKGWQAIATIAGVGAGEESATKAQGFHRKYMLIIYEEMAGIHPAMVTAFNNTCTGETNMQLGVGNPDDQFDQLNVFSQQVTTRNYRISAYDHPNVVLKREQFEGAVTIKSIENRKITQGEDSPMFQSRVRGLTPENASNALIQMSWINLACQRNPDTILKWSPNAAGVDVANSNNGDFACVAYGRGPSLVYVKEFRCPSATHLAYNMIYDSSAKEVNDINNYNDYDIPTLTEMDVAGEFVGIDGVGVGVATVNTLTDMYYKIRSLEGHQYEEAILKDQDGVTQYNFVSLRAQMYFQLREDLREGHISIDAEAIGEKMVNQIKRELTSILFEQKSGKIYVEPKELIKKKFNGKSPNVADAVAYWNWMRNNSYGESTISYPMC